jgi:metal-responsive CopG/Arc/MetJ family transcriptional regulator
MSKGNQLVPVRFPPQLLSRLDRACEITGRSRSDLIRDALDWALTEAEKPSPPPPPKRRRPKRR